MKLTIILVIILMFIGGCSTTQNLSGTNNLLLNEQDIQQLGMAKGDCLTEEYQTGEYSPLAQYNFCNYTINSLNTQVVIELKQFTNLEDRNGSYQYESLHLRGYQGANEDTFQGLISENKYGDMSSFYFNNESSVYYHHLYIGKDEYLIHITSKGSKEAREYITKTGQQILSKFR